MKITKKKILKLVKGIIVICLVYFICTAFYSVIVSINDYKSNIASVQSEIDVEKKNNEELKDQKVNMHSDETYKEIARKTLGLVEPGDKVYINTNDNN